MAPSKSTRKIATNSEGIDFRQLLLTSEDVPTRIRKALSYSKKILLGKLSVQFVESLLGEIASVPGRTRDLIRESVVAIDHLGFVVPAFVEIKLLEKLAIEEGFTQHEAFPSVLFAKELGELVGQKSVPTQIFRCGTGGGSGKATAVEMFVPMAEPRTVDSWIRSGVGTHVAFLVKERGQVDRIKDQLLAEGFRMPAFMNRASMENRNAGTLTAYFDLVKDGAQLRVEFLHVNSNPNEIS